MAYMTINGMLTVKPDLFNGVKLPGDLTDTDLQEYCSYNFYDLETVFTDPDNFAKAIQIWSDKNQRSWLQIYEALTVDYSPIENFDRQEDWTEEGTGMSENSVTSFNSRNYYPADKQEQGGKSKHSGRMHGNIGVTTNQQMITSELELRKNTFIDLVADDFKNTFLLQVY